MCAVDVDVVSVLAWSSSCFPVSNQLATCSSIIAHCHNRKMQIETKNSRSSNWWFASSNPFDSASSRLASFPLAFPTHRCLLDHHVRPKNQSTTNKVQAREPPKYCTKNRPEIRPKNRPEYHLLNFVAQETFWLRKLKDTTRHHSPWKNIRFVDVLALRCDSLKILMRCI